MITDVPAIFNPDKSEKDTIAIIGIAIYDMLFMFCIYLTSCHIRKDNIDKALFRIASTP